MSSPLLYDTPRVGGDVLSFCSKCQIELAHVVFSMVNGRPAKVICKTCKSQHRYKLSTMMGSPKSPRVPRQKTVRISVSELWDKKLRESKGEPIPYQPKGTFKLGDWIKHTKFGLGIIEEVKLDSKIIVLFREGEKTLVHGLK